MEEQTIRADHDTPLVDASLSDSASMLTETMNQLSNRELQGQCSAAGTASLRIPSQLRKSECTGHLMKVAPEIRTTALNLGLNSGQGG